MCIRDRLDSIPMSNRMFGYQLALSDAKLPFDPSLLYIGDWSIDSGYKLASEMIKSGKIPDAIFSQNDEMAAGICQAFAKHGISKMCIRDRDSSPKLKHRTRRYTEHTQIFH